MKTSFKAIQYAMLTMILLLMPMISLAASTDLYVYTPLEDDQIPRYLKSFKKAHPEINLKIVRDSNGIITAKLLAEKKNPRADVIWGLAATSLLVLDQNGMLEPYSPKGIEKVLPEFKDSRRPTHWVGIDAWMTGFCVNTYEIESLGLPVPKSFQDLVNPAYRGHMVMPNPASSGTGFLTVSAVLQLMGERKGWAFLDRLHENIAFYTHSGSKPCKLAGAGEFPIGVSFGYRGIIQKRKGEPVLTQFPAEGSGWDLEANALVKKRNIKPAARVFLDWAIGKTVMKEYGKSFAITSVPTGETVPEGFPEEPSKQLAANDLDWAAKNRKRILDEWSRRYDGKSLTKN